ncbi:MAG: cytochrome c [candidate division NC10 bacterium]|nr:cytochrome c [candidate division NC10 bacterium]MDE2321094.1 cytochrome c [candidate division NC10 bacterium]
MRKATIQVTLLTVLVVGSAGAWTAASANTDPKAPEKYTTFCVPCHGPAGKGDGLAAASLNPKPRNFTDGKYMNTRTDAQVINVIKNGSAAEKLSPLMTGYGSMLNEKEIKEIVAFIRSVAVPKYQPKK